MLEERMAAIEGKFEQVDKRLNHLGADVREIREELSKE